MVGGGCMMVVVATTTTTSTEIHPPQEQQPQHHHYLISSGSRGVVLTSSPSSSSSKRTTKTDAVTGTAAATTTTTTTTKQMMLFQQQQHPKESNNVPNINDTEVHNCITNPTTTRSVTKEQSMHDSKRYFTGAAGPVAGPTTTSIQQEQEQEQQQQQQQNDDDDMSSLLNKRMPFLRIQSSIRDDVRSVATGSSNSMSTNTMTSNTDTTTTTANTKDSQSTNSWGGDAFRDGSCSSNSASASSSNGSNHYKNYNDNGNTILHDAIIDFPMNVLHDYGSKSSCSQRKSSNCDVSSENSNTATATTTTTTTTTTTRTMKEELELQIRTIAQEHPHYVTTYNQNGQTPFHIACQLGGISLQIIQDLYHCNPSAISIPTKPPKSVHPSSSSRRLRHRRLSITSTKLQQQQQKQLKQRQDQQLLLPLHLACRYYSGIEQAKIIHFLIQMYPNACRIRTICCSNDNCTTATTKTTPTTATTIGNPNSCCSTSTTTTTYSNHTSKQENDSITTCSKDSNNTFLRNNKRCGDYALHLYCQNHFCTIDVVQMLIQQYPKALYKFNSTGQIPIHIACARKYYYRIRSNKYDHRMKTKIAGINDDVIRYLIQVYPKSCYVPNQIDQELPFAIAIRGYQPIDTLQYILVHNPDAILQQDIHGRTPLHKYCMNRMTMMMTMMIGDDDSKQQQLQQRVTQELNVEAVGNDPILQLLLQYDTKKIAGTMMDTKGYLPIHYCLSSSSSGASINMIYTLIRHYPTSIEKIASWEHDPPQLQ